MTDGPNNRAWKRGIAAKNRERRKRKARAIAAAAAAKERLMNQDTLNGITPKTVDGLIRRLNQQPSALCSDAALYLSELLLRLRTQERRLRAIEDAVNGFSTEGEGDREEFPTLLASFDARLELVQQACPWDDDNEHGSWMFAEDDHSYMRAGQTCYCKGCDKPVAYAGAVFCGAACSARHEGRDCGCHGG
jgi:hypothetical protein